MRTIELRHRPDLAAEMDPSGHDWWWLTVDGAMVASSVTAVGAALKARKRGSITDHEFLALESRESVRDYAEATASDMRPKRKGRDEMGKKKADPKPKNGDSKEVRVTHGTKRLRVELGADELAERADRAAHLLEERDQIEEAAKAAAKHAKAQVDEKEAQLRALSSEIRDRATYRDVQIETRHIYRTGKVETWRLDTSEQIDERALLPHELQQSLPGVEDQDGEDEELDGSAEDNRPADDESEKPRRGRRAKAESQPEAD